MDTAAIVGWTPEERAAAMNARAADTAAVEEYAEDLDHSYDVGFAAGATSEQRKCCEDICSYCKEGNQAISEGLLHNTWQHRIPDKTGGAVFYKCEANTIRQRTAEGK